MKIKFKTLTLQCRQSREILDLSHQISFFHGKVSSGKSSIARLIDFCFGGDLERTPAIIQELVSVTLELYIGEHLVLIERHATSYAQARVTWQDFFGYSSTTLAPIQPSTRPIWGNNVFSLSDLIFYLLGIDPLLISSNKNIDEGKLSRLSFRNFMWYCYLDQHHLDSSFYRLEDSNKSRNSKEVMKFIMQYSNQELINLEASQIKARDERVTKLATAKELRSFLARFGYSTENDIEKEIEDTKSKLAKAEEERKKQEAGYIKDTHTSDELRNKIREISNKIEQGNETIIELEQRLREQEALRSELISSKFKLARSASVASILSGVKFDNCPQCGNSVKSRIIPIDACSLCLTEQEIHTPTINDNAEIIRLDIDARINDIELSIANHTDALKRQKKILLKQSDIKRILETQLSEQLKVYESIFLSNIREVDRQVATYKERLKGQSKLKEMPKEITKLERQADQLLVKEQEIKRSIEAATKKLLSAEKNVRDLEETFLETLLSVGLPGVSEDDEVHINRKTWDVFVYPNGEEYKKWNFFECG